MIISEQWLRDWIHVDLDAEQIADCLTNAGLEVDGVSRLSGPIENLVVGKVLQLEKHPDADRLNLTKVDIGTDILDIVCGAANVRAEQLVAVATVGAKLPNGMEIKQAKVRGVESNGMLCSAAELGLEEQSDGIIELDEDAEIGSRVDEYLQLDDALIDIDLTPNRGDCLSVQGIARELKVLADGDYHPLDVQKVEPNDDQQIDIVVQDDQACPSYLGRVISGIDPLASSPRWMQERLRRCGVRPISAVVDIGNYVMLEIGQPMHAFDRDKLKEKIIVRQSIKGESITLLDDSEATLDHQTLVIADSAGPIAIAGVMGGLHSAIDDDSKNIVLEAAHFTRKSASGCARRYGLHTEASHRFERGVDPLLPPVAIQRATELVLEICGGTAGPVVEQINAKGLLAKPPVDVRLSRLSKLLGMQLSEAEVGQILNRVADKVEAKAQSWTVTPPSYRFDIQYEADLVEEVARVKGYENIPTAMPRIAPRSQAASEARIGWRLIRQSLIARDYHEAITYSFIDPAKQKMFSDEQAIVLDNPLAENMSVMRTTLLPGLLDALAFNANRQHDRIRLYEVGASYHRDENGIRETNRLAAVISGPRYPTQWAENRADNADFYDLKGDLASVLALTGKKEPFIFNEFEHIAMHPGQVSQITHLGRNDQQIELGWIGRLHPVLQNELGLSAPVYALEIDLDKATEAQIPVYTGISRFPSVKRDLSVVVADDVLAASMINAVRGELGKSLNNAVVFDVYRGEGVTEGHKSVSLSLVFQDLEKTMTDAESESLMSAALDVLKRDFDALLR